MTRQCGKKALALNQHSSREDTDVSDPQFTSETQKQPERRAGLYRSCSGRAESPLTDPVLHLPTRQKRHILPVFFEKPNQEHPIESVTSWSAASALLAADCVQYGSIKSRVMPTAGPAELLLR